MCKESFEANKQIRRVGISSKRYSVVYYPSID